MAPRPPVVGNGGRTKGVIRAPSVPVKHPTHPISKPGKGVGTPRANRTNKQLVADRAVGALRNALTEGGMSSADAMKYARVALQQKGVTLGKGGAIYYQGKRMDASSFAKSPLVNYVTGVKAANQNKALITADPGYQLSLAAATLKRDQALADYTAQRNQAVIQFGDPSYAGSDSLLAGEAQANPNSTAALLNLEYGRAQQGTNMAANRLGVGDGGGVQSGQTENGRVHVAQEQDATTKLQTLLDQIARGSGDALQQYTLDQNTAYQQAYQDLLKAGTLHAVGAPSVTTQGFHYYQPPVAVSHPGQNPNPGGHYVGGPVPVAQPPAAPLPVVPHPVTPPIPRY